MLRITNPSSSINLELGISIGHSKIVSGLIEQLLCEFSYIRSFVIMGLILISEHASPTGDYQLDSLQEHTTKLTQLH